MLAYSLILMPECKKCSRNAVTKVVTCKSCGLVFHEGCLARYVEYKGCASCCRKTYREFVGGIDPAQVERVNRGSIFDEVRDLEAESLLGISTLSSVSHSSGINDSVYINVPDTAAVSLVGAQSNTPPLNMSLPSNWGSLSIDDKLGEMFRQSGVALSVAQELSNKFDLLSAKFDDHDKRIAELECDNSNKDAEIANLKERIDKEYKYDEIKVSGIPRACQVPLNDITTAIFKLLKVTNDLADVHSVYELKGRPQNAAVGGTQPATSLMFCMRFKSVCVRDSVLKAKRAFGQLKLGQIISGGGEYVIELHEMLSPYVHKLRLAAKARANVAGYKYVWTRGDKVLVRKTDGSEVISIITNSDLERIQ